MQDAGSRSGQVRITRSESGGGGGSLENVGVVTHTTGRDLWNVGMLRHWLQGCNFPIGTVAGAVAPPTLSFVPPTFLLSHQASFFRFGGLQLTIAGAVHAKIANANAF